MRVGMGFLAVGLGGYTFWERLAGTKEGGLMKEVIGRRLSIECNRLGLTVTKAAADAGCSRRTWCYYESGSTMPDAVILNRLDAMGFDVMFIITGRRTRQMLDVPAMNHPID